MSKPRETISPIFPPALKPGDKIGVFAPSSFVEQEDIEKSKKILEDRGYEVFIHPQSYERHNQSAGTNLQKALAFQGLWQRQDIKAIWAAGGGNRCLHLIESINFEKLKARPKILIGFSDVTALLNAVYTHTGVVSFHGPVFKNVHKHEELTELLELLSGKVLNYSIKDAKILHHGKAEGPLIGGNLSLFQYLPSTLPGNFAQDAILFLEDCHEEISKIDRMLLHLKRTGVLENISALVLGQFSDLTDAGRPYGFTLEDIILEHMEGLDIPVIMDMPFGHSAPFHTFPVGAPAEINTQESFFRLSKPACTTS